ncbi:hypothetical protein A9Q99_01970 [Gammaproteobacteria bacterium 45_16_T64]|nr:hypothetical protein A9Q99_01970 [Gammaproteobacteria bacterium 45_16_T64]
MSGRLIIALLFTLSWNCYGQWHKQDAGIMGTSIKVEIWHSDAERAKVLMSWVFDEMRRIDRLMSPYKPKSELALINSQASLGPVTVSPELFRLLQMSVAHGVRSEGQFDITFASIGYRYDYRQSIKPEESEIAQALPAIDFRSIKLESAKNTVMFLHPNTRIDLGGIAKGYAVDLAVDYLIKQGIQHGIVTAGGDSRIIGDRKGRPWMLGVKSPRGEGHIVTLPVESLALSTSGDYERFFEVDGKRHHHIIDPSSGRSVTGVQSVTIMGPTAMQTDALSTTVFVMGVKKGLAYIEQQSDYSAIIIDDRGKLFYSSDLVNPR